MARGCASAAASEVAIVDSSCALKVAHAFVPAHRLLRKARLLARDASLPERGRQAGAERDKDAGDAGARRAVALHQAHEAQAHPPQAAR